MQASPSGRPGGSTAQLDRAGGGSAPERREQDVGPPAAARRRGRRYDPRGSYGAARGAARTTERSYTVLLYSDDPQVRDRMRLAIGTRPAADLSVEFVDASTYDEASGWSTTTRSTCWCSTARRRPAGGLGIARQLKDEIADAPPDLRGDRPRRRPLARRVRPGRRAR